MTDMAEYLSERITDSRRIFGPNIFCADAGAVLEVMCCTPADHEVIGLWPAEVQRYAEALSWTSSKTYVRQANDTASLFLTAPVDGLMTATDVAERAWLAAEHRVAGTVVLTDFALTSLLDTYVNEQREWPDAVRCWQDARAAGRNVTINDDGVFVGSGPGAQSVLRQRAKTPRAEQLVPAKYPDVASSQSIANDAPIVLVTGSNGKTTTVRLLTAMWRATRRTVGWCCSDGVWVGDTEMETGDFSGPFGAHLVLTDPRVQAAVLESARGGMLRRGLAVSAADGAVITNISADHFGEYGIDTLDDLAEVKGIVARALRPGAALVLNADDVSLVTLSQKLTCPIVWFSATDSLKVHRAHAHGETAATVRDGTLQLCDGTNWHSLAAIDDIPITYGGRAAHNIENALAAALVAFVVGIPLPAIKQTLTLFGASPNDNPGRMQVREVGGVTVVMDYAHNPVGLESLCRTAANMPAKRRLLLLGQAGDRDDAQLAALAETAQHTVAFDRYIIKEMASMVRGRPIGQISRILHAALLAAGASEENIEAAPTELDGVRQALAWAQAGDQLILGIHVDRDAAYALMDQLTASGWQPGRMLPPG